MCHQSTWTRGDIIKLFALVLFFSTVRFQVLKVLKVPKVPKVLKMLKVIKVLKVPKVPKLPKVQYCRPRQTIADHGRPKHSDIRGATSISDAFIDLKSLTCHVYFGKIYYTVSDFGRRTSCYRLHFVKLYFYRCHRLKRMRFGLFCMMNNTWGATKSQKLWPHIYFTTFDICYIVSSFPMWIKHDCSHFDPLLVCLLPLSVEVARSGLTEFCELVVCSSWTFYVASPLP